jgi:hypothetical protein
LLGAIYFPQFVKSFNSEFKLFATNGFAWLLILGGEATQAKSRVSARGRVDTETGKKAIGEMLDSGLASLKNPQMPKAKAKGKAKATPKQKAKGDADKDKANKELQKDIKAFLGKIRINHMALQLHSSKKCAASFSPIPLWPHKCAPRLREKSSKARELAVQLNERGIPHQDVPWLNCCGSPSCSIKFMVCVRPWLKICRSATHCFEMSLRGLHVVFFFA